MPDSRIKVSLNTETLTRVDEARGLIPRQRWLRQLIEQHFEQYGAGGGNATFRIETDGAQTQVEPVSGRPLAEVPETVERKMVFDTTTRSGTVAALTPDSGKANHRFRGLGKHCGLCGGTREEHPA